VELRTYTVTGRGSRGAPFSAARRAQFASVRRFPRARRKALRLLPRLPPSDGWPRKIRLLPSARPPAISPSWRRTPAVPAGFLRRGAASRAHAGEHPPCACRGRPERGRPRVSSGHAHGLYRGAGHRPIAPGSVPAGSRSHALLRRRVRPGPDRLVRMDAVASTNRDRAQVVAEGVPLPLGAPAMPSGWASLSLSAAWMRPKTSARRARSFSSEWMRCCVRRPGSEGFLPPLGVPAQHGGHKRARRVWT
jgi:hypothetical protein